VAERAGPAPLLAALRAFVAWLDATGTRGAIIGGVAASLLGRPRVTGDVDALVLVDEDVWEEFLAAGAVHGIRARRPDAVAFARRSRVLLLRHEPSGIDLDVSVGLLPFEHELVARARRRRVRGIAVPLPAPEDLVVMKAIAHRARDLGDIEGIVAMHPRLDTARIRRLVRAFAKVLDAPEIVADLERVLDRVRPRRRGRAKRR
jgi:hypothetical protein